MSHHMIFIDGSVANQRPKDVVLTDLGLEDHIAGCDVMPVSSEESPSGAGGLLFAWRSKTDTQLRYSRGEQTWMKSAGGYWVGIWNDNPPTEGDLRRTYMQNGEFLPFCSKGTWKLPLPSTIDMKIALGDDGTWKYVPIRELSWYTEEISQRLAECEFTGEGEEMRRSVQFNMLEVTSLIVRALRINYRLTAEVCHMIDMFTQRNVSVAYSRMLGMTFEE